MANHISWVSSNSAMVFINMHNNYGTNMYFIFVYIVGQILNIFLNNKYLLLTKLFVFHNIITRKTASLRPDVLLIYVLQYS